MELDDEPVDVDDVVPDVEDDVAETPRVVLVDDGDAKVSTVRVG